MAETLSLTFPDISWPKMQDFSDWAQSEKPSQSPSGYEDQQASPSWLHHAQKSGSSFWETISPFALDWGMNALPMPFAAAYNAYSVYNSAQSLSHQENSNNLGAIVTGGLLTLSVVSMFLPLLGAVRKKAPDLSALKKLFEKYWSEANYFKLKIRAEGKKIGFLKFGLSAKEAHRASYEVIKKIPPEPSEVRLFAFIQSQLDAADPHIAIKEVMEVIPGLGAHSVTLAKAKEGRFDRVILADRDGEFSAAVGLALKKQKINNVTQHTIPDLTPENIHVVAAALPQTPHVLMVHPTRNDNEFEPPITISLFLSALGHPQAPRKVFFFDSGTGYDYESIINLVKTRTGQVWRISQRESDTEHHMVIFENVVQNL